MDVAWLTHLRSARLVDLSLPLRDDLPCVWPGQIPFQRKVWSWFADEEDGPSPLVRRGPVHVGWLLLDEHAGTHVDAPSHFIPPPGSGLPDAGPAGGTTVDRLDVSMLIGPACVVDCDALPACGPGRSPVVDVDHLESWEVEHGPFSVGDVVLLRGDWDAHFRPMSQGGGRYLEDPLVRRTTSAWPSPSADAVSYLADRGVRCLGTDGPSVGAAHGPREAHIAGLGRGMAYAEGLANLGLLPARGALVMVLPLKIARGSAAPARAVAFVWPDAPLNDLEKATCPSAPASLA